MRRAAKVDDNQGEIVSALEELGYSVRSLAPIGKGFPDIIFAQHGRNHLAEIKDGKKIPSERRLTPDQVDFHRDWRGKIYIFESLDDVLRANAEIQRKLVVEREN